MNTPGSYSSTHSLHSVFLCWWSLMSPSSTSSSCWAAGATAIGVVVIVVVGGVLHPLRVSGAVTRPSIGDPAVPLDLLPLDGSLAAIASCASQIHNTSTAIESNRIKQMID